MELISKRVEDSVTESTHIVMPSHLNGANRLFGGILMQWIDETAGIVAMRHAQANVTTAAVDNLKFLKGAYPNDLVVVRGKVTYVGRTSMEVRVDTYVESLDGIRRPINRAYFVMVAIDENDRPTPVPKLIVESPQEIAEWEMAKLRNQMRKQRKTEGF